MVLPSVEGPSPVRRTATPAFDIAALEQRSGTPVVEQGGEYAGGRAASLRAISRDHPVDKGWFRGSLALAPQPPAQGRLRWSSRRRRTPVVEQGACERSVETTQSTWGGFEARWRSHL